MIDVTQSQSDRAIALGRATMVAVAAIESERRTMRVLPLLAASDELRVPLHALAAWYERLCIDTEYATPAPAEGIEALPLIAQLVTGTPRCEVRAAWWVVRVAEEVVVCRQLLGSGDDSDSSKFELALSQLEIAMHGWQQHSSKDTAVIAGERGRMNSTSR